MIIDIIRTWEGLVEYRNTFPGGPIGFFSDVAQWTFVYKNMVYLLQTLVGDGVVVSHGRVRSLLIISFLTSCPDLSLLRRLAIMVDYRLSHRIMGFCCR